MNTQDIFDTVARHLLTQRKQSRRTATLCGYRDRDDKQLKCAAGCLIADEHYSEDLEGAMVNAANVRAAVERSIGRELTGAIDDPRSEISLLYSLQSVHDSAAVGRWPERLRSVATDFELSPSTVNEMERANAAENHAAV